MKFCVYTRSYYENQFLNFFIEHYINLGFDKIIILKSDNINYVCPPQFLQYVDFHIVQNLGDKLLPRYNKLVKNTDFDWILSVDIDEILLLNSRYKKINDYVKEKLLINSNINIFYFRWAMIEKYDISTDNNFKDILTNYKIFKNFHIKTMVNRKKLKNINHPHICNINTKINVYFENNILHYNKPILEFSTNMYAEAVLIHIHTRSIHNIVLKAFLTMFQAKKIFNINKFIEYINDLDVTLENNNAFEIFKEYIGIKSVLPFVHTNYGLSDINITQFSIHDYKYSVFDTCDDKLSILDCLKNNNINIDKYYYFINKVNEQITLKYKNLFFN